MILKTQNELYIYQTRASFWDVALVLPRVEGFHFRFGPWVLHPLDHLGVCYEINVLVFFQYFVNPKSEGLQELGVVLEPGGVEIEAHGGAVLLVVSVELRELVGMVILFWLSWNYYFLISFHGIFLRNFHGNSKLLLEI